MYAAEKGDYEVTVGGLPCNVTELNANLLMCRPPKESDIPPNSPGNHFRDDDGNPRVAVSHFDGPVINYGKLGTTKWENCFSENLTLKTQVCQQFVRLTSLALSIGRCQNYQV